MVGLKKKKTVTHETISPKMANPRDKAGEYRRRRTYRSATLGADTFTTRPEEDEEDEEEEEENTGCHTHVFSDVQT